MIEKTYIFAKLSFDERKITANYDAALRFYKGGSRRSFTAAGFELQAMLQICSF